MWLRLKENVIKVWIMWLKYVKCDWCMKNVIEMQIMQPRYK